MTISLADFAHVTAAQSFGGLHGCLEKAKDHVSQTSVDEATLLNWRLASDMFPMKRQVQIATDVFARGMSRLAGAELPSMPDTEESFDELQRRIEKARHYVSDLDHEAISANPQAELTFPVGDSEMTLTRQHYLLNFVMPNMFFHVTTAYNNLRAAGVPLGKRDYLSRP